jgi:hypothetical protein
MRIHLLIPVLLLSLISCSGPERTVEAHSSGPSTISLDCSKAQEVGQNDDGLGTLTINWGPCVVNATGNKPVGMSATLSYTLQHPISARVLDAWIGTMAGSKIEIGYYMKITTPEGRQGLFLNQLDKHQDVIGNSAPHQWNLPLNLPANTRIDIGLAVGVTNPETDCPCGIHAQWFLNHGFD